MNSNPPPAFDAVNYSKANTHYPDSTTSHNTESKVIVRYAINEDGSMGDMTILKGLTPELDSQAIKAVLSMPRPKPGKQNGKYVKVYFNQPIVFKK